MAIYVDPLYVYHKDKWSRLRIPFIESVGTQGSWEAIEGMGWDVVTNAAVSLPSVVKIDPTDGEPGGEGVLSKMVDALDQAKLRALPNKAIRAEEQRAEAGSAPHVDKAVIQALSQEDELSGEDSSDGKAHGEEVSILESAPDRPRGGFGDE